MKLSIITATLNNKSGLLRAIESVRSQTYKNVEHIIVDGGSTDGSVEVMKQVQDDILRQAQDDMLRQAQDDMLRKAQDDILRQAQNNKFKFVSEMDNGIYDAINKGIKMATGDVIGLLHSDDFYADNEVLIDVVHKFKDNVSVVFGDLVYISKDDNNKILRVWKSGDFKKSKLNFGWMPPHPTMFIKKELFDKYGQYDETFKIASDYDFILRILSKDSLKISYLNRILVKMQTGGMSNGSLKNIIKKSKEDYMALKKNNFHFPFFTLMNKNFRKLNQFILQ